MPASNLAIGKLPPANYLALNMTRGNYVLISVFGPTLLKTTEGSASLSSLVDTVHQTRVVELLTRYQKLQMWKPAFPMITKYTNLFRHATSVFGPPPIPGEGPGGRGSRQRPSDRHSGSDAVPADIRIGTATLVPKYRCMKLYF